jgi:phospholipid transport system substrate-binding protein
MNRIFARLLLPVALTGAFATTASARKAVVPPTKPPAATATAASKGAATEAVKKANKTIAEQLAKKPEVGSAQEKQVAKDVTATVRDFIDLDALATRALVDHWAKLSDAQRSDYLSLLRSLLEDNYVRGMRSNLDYTVDYTSEAASAAGATVVNTVIKAKRKGRPYSIKVDYTVEADSKGKLHVVDIATDGVGLIENYRTQFNKIIAKDGFDGLIAKMKKKQSSAK